MKVLITGGAGFVGTALIPQLLQKKYKVHVLDNLMFGGDQLLPFFRNKFFSFQKGDIRNIQDVKTAMTDADIVIHLAAIVGFPACRKEPKIAQEINIIGTKNIVAAASKDQHIFFASTGSNYGAVLDKTCTEETPLNPLSLYGQTKVLGEQHILEKHSRATIYRFATAFGLAPRLRLDLMINDFVYKALTQQYLVVYEKNFMRTFIHVHDMGRSFLFGIDHAKQMRGHSYNVGSKNMNFSKEEICQLISKLIKFYVHYADIGEDADKRNYVVSYEKIIKLGYRTTIGIEEGINELTCALPAIKTKTSYTNI